MNRKNLVTIVKATMIALTVAAVCQELRKPKGERTWHGKVLGFIPYDFRLPTIKRLKEAYWNPYDRRVLSPRVFGVGWAINFYALLENMGIICPAITSEEDFLMPTKSIKDVLTNTQ